MSQRTPLTTRTLLEWAIELGIDTVGVCAATAYDTTEQAIAERGARGLFADLKFTMARPDDSCHPERQVDRASSVVSAALSYWYPDAALEGDEPRGIVARYTRSDAYEALASRLETLAERIRERGFEARVLVDSNFHVDREAAHRSGVGFYGKHTNIITRRHGSWVVLGTIITSAHLDPTEPMRPGCGTCTACIDACPTDAIIEPGVLDTTACLTYWTQSRHSLPERVRLALGTRVYGCDICQDVCPWNRGVEGRRAGEEPLLGTVSLREWLELPDEQLDERYERFFVPRRQMRFLRRNALVALGNSEDPRAAALIAPWLDSEDEMIREHAAWALTRLGGPVAEAALERQREH